MKRKGLLRLLSVVMCVAMVLVSLPVVTSADGEASGNDALLARDKICILCQWDHGLYGNIAKDFVDEYQEYWMGFAACGWFSICHALQWLNVINIDNREESKDLFVEWLNDCYKTVETVETESYISKIVKSWLLDKYNGKLKLMNYEGSTKVEMLKNILNANGVAILSGCGHYFTAVDISDDGKYIHIVDSCLNVQCYNKLGIYYNLYTYDNNNNTFKKIKEASKYDGGTYEKIANYMTDVATNYYWDKNINTNNYEMIKGIAQKRYSGGEYWVDINELANKSGITYAFESNCTHSYNTSSGTNIGICQNCGAVGAFTYNATDCDKYFTPNEGNFVVRSTPYNSNSSGSKYTNILKTLSSSDVKYLHISQTGTNCLGHTWYKSDWYIDKNNNVQNYECYVYSGNGLLKKSLTNEYKIGVETYTINLSSENMCVAVMKVTYGKPYGTLPTVSRSGHDFLGWYTSDGEKVVASTIFYGNSDTTLYARWSESKDILFKNIGGSHAYASYSVKEDDATLIATIRPVGYALTDISYAGIVLRQGTTVLAEKTDKYYQENAENDFWYYVKSELGVTLEPNTEYNYYFYVKATDGTTLKVSDVQTFKTAALTSKCAYFSNIGGSISGTRYSGDTYGADYSVTDTDATLVTRITVSGAKITDVSYLGIELYQGDTKIAYKEEKNTSKADHIDAWYYATSELNATLKPGTDYRYRFFVRFGTGANVYSDYYYFKTTGTSYYVVTFNGNGGVPSQASKTVAYSYTYGTLPTASYYGYTFLGWYNANGEKITEQNIYNLTQNQTLYAYWAENAHNIYFNACGGEVSTQSILVLYNAQIGTLPVPYKVGYTFDGWYTSAYGGTRIYDNSFYSKDEATTLYAHWIANKYNVYFDTCGGSVSQASINVTYNLAYGALPTPTNPGYTFAGWFTEAYSGTQIYESSLYLNSNDSILYAHWTPNNYTVYFDANGGSVSPSSREITYTYAYWSMPTPTRDGYAFAGWFTEKTGGTRIYETTVYLNSYSTTLYAHWVTESYTVTFDPQGGTVNENSRVIEYLDQYGQLPIPEKNGCVFDGWYNAIEGGSKISDSQTFNLTGNQTLYAHWKQKIEFELNGGNYEDYSSSINISRFNCERLTDEVIVYNISGETVDTNQYGVEIAVASNGKVTGVRYYGDTDNKLTVPDGGFVVSSHTDYSNSSSLFLAGCVGHYVGIDYNNMKVIRYDTYNEWLFNQKTLINGNTYGDLPTPYKTGYIFDGWYSDESCITKITSASTFTSAQAQKLYARWIDSTYTVSFNANGGDVLTESKTVTYTSEYGSLPTPTNPGCVFEGWHTQPYDGEEITETSIFSLTKNQTLYAHWSLITDDITDNETYILNVCTGVLKLLGDDDYADASETPWHEYKKYITKIIVSDGVSKIGDRAFSGFNNITEIEIPDSVNSIGKYAFSECSSLETIIIPDNIMSIDEYAFKSCTALKEVSLSKNLTAVSNGLFNCCSALETIIIPSSVSSIGASAFENCSQLKEITMYDNTLSIGENAFSSCDEISTIYFFGTEYEWNNITGTTETDISENATLHYSMIGGTCGSDATWKYDPTTFILTISGSGTVESTDTWSNLKTSAKKIIIEDGITTIGENAFSDFDYVETVVFGSDVIEIKMLAFGYCSRLKNIEFNDGIRKIGESAFYNCSNLVSVNLPYCVSFINRWVFSCCLNLKEINVDERNLNYTSVDGVLFSKDMTVLIRYPQAKTLTEYTVPDGVDYIKYWAFEDSSLLQKLSIPESVTNIGYYAFSGCTSLNTIELYNSITSVGTKPYYDCSALTSVVFKGDAPDCIENYKIPSTVTLYYYEGAEGFTTPTWNGYNTVEIVSAVSVTGITLDKSSVNIGVGSAFTLTPTVEPSNATNQNITWSTSDANIATVENGVVTGVNAGTVTITATTEDGGFTATCVVEISAIDESLYTYTVSDGKATITGVDESISGDVVIPSTLGGYPVTKIGNCSFYGCNNITSIIIPDSVTSIGESAFYNCSKLVYINIPYCVSSISRWVFSCCLNLKEINVDERNVNYTSVDGVLFSEDMTVLIRYPQAKTLTEYTVPDGVDYIKYWAFEDSSLLQKLSIPESVTNIGYYAFSGCTSLNTIELYNSITSVGTEPYYDCSALTSVVFKGDAPDCIENYKIPSTVTIYYYEGAEGFTTPTWNGYNTVEIVSAVSVTGITLDKSSVNIGVGSAFTLTPTVEPSNATNQNITWSTSDANIATVENGVVTGVNAGTVTITATTEDGGFTATCVVTVSAIDESLYTYTVSGGEGTIADVGTSTSKEATITDVDTSISGDAIVPSTLGGYPVTAIGSHAFEDCNNLTSIEIPSSITSIGNDAFAGCSNLKTINYNGLETQWNSISGLEDAGIPDDCTIKFFPTEFKNTKYYASLTLNDNIDVNFKVRKLGDGFDEKLLSITVDGKISKFTYDSESGEVTCVLKAVSPKDINKTMDIVVTYGGTEVKSIEYSVRKYCESVFATSGVDSKLGELCKAVLNYGKYAEDYFNKNSESTTNKGYVQDFDSITIPTPTPSGFVASSEISKASAFLALDSVVALNFKLSTTMALTKDNITIVNENNKAVSASDITLTEINENGYNYKITINNLGASMLAHSYTLKIDDATILTYGVYNYCYSVNTVATSSVYTETLKTLCKAIYNYGEAAKAYAESIK